MFRGFAKRLKARTDNEHQQALVRFCVIAAFSLYIYLVGTRAQFPPALWDTIRTAVFIYTFAASLIFLHILADPNRKPPRRIAGIILDNVMLSAALLVLGESTAPWYPFYLWIIFGNGFRYGEKYLWTATAASITCFATVLLLTPFWQQHLELGIGLLMGLAILPAYAAALTRQLNFERERAQLSSRVKSEFISRMTHEIRTPLNGIISMSELLKSCRLGTREKEIADTINESGRKLLGLAENVLDFSNLEAGTLPIEHKEFDLHGVINRSIHMMSVKARDKGLVLTCHFDHRIPFRLTGDPQHLNQALMNLLDNGLKFTETGMVRLLCKHLGNDGDTSRIRFEVSDTGIGISETAQKSIFETFAQADESVTRRYDGTGLGISIASHLVEKMGGNINLESEPGMGSRFWFDLGFRQQDGLVDEQDMVDIRRCRVLRLTPPDQEITDISHSLKGWGVPFTDIHDLDSALERMAAEKPVFDILVIDGFPLDHPVMENLSSLHTMMGTDILIAGNQDEKEPPPEATPYYIHRLKASLKKPHLFNALHARLPVNIHGADNAQDDNTDISLEPGLKVLVAEDNKINSIIMAQILERTGALYQLVSNGQEVLDAIASADYDLVILDMQMPILNGLDTYRQYCNNTPEDKRLPFIMLTANATTEMRDACMEVGITRFLTKPVSVNRLISAIGEATGSDSVTKSEDAVLPRAETAPLIDQFIVKSVIDLAPNKDFLLILLASFKQDAESIFSNMSSAHENNEFQAYTRLAHALKGSAANLGLIQLQRLSSEVESASVDTFTANGLDLISSLKGCFDTSIEVLRNKMGLTPDESETTTDPEQ